MAGRRTSSGQKRSIAEALASAADMASIPEGCEDGQEPAQVRMLPSAWRHRRSVLPLEDPGAQCPLRCSQGNSVDNHRQRPLPARAAAVVTLAALAMGITMGMMSMRCMLRANQAPSLSTPR